MQRHKNRRRTTTSKLANLIKQFDNKLKFANACLVAFIHPSNSFDLLGSGKITRFVHKYVNPLVESLDGWGWEGFSDFLFCVERMVVILGT